MQAKLINAEGKEAGVAELNPAIFEVNRKNTDVVHQTLVAFLANRRRVVAHTKTRGEVRGGGRKPWRQKGTGRARHGSTRSPIWRGGGVTFGPRPEQNYAKKVNRAAARLAMFLVLSDRARENKVHVLESLPASSGKTKDLVGFLQTLKPSLNLGKKVLMIVPAPNENLVRSSRNLDNVTVRTAGNLNVFDTLAATDIFILKEALPVLEKTYLKK